MSAIPAKLVVVSGDKRFEVDMEHLLTIGRQPDATIQLADDLVSKYHCQIVALDGQFILRDGQSRNGTWMGGERITEVELYDGDEFTIGRATFKLAGGPAPPAQRRGVGQAPRPDETATVLPAIATGVTQVVKPVGKPAGGSQNRSAAPTDQDLAALNKRVNELSRLVAMAGSEASALGGRLGAVDQVSARVADTVQQQERVIRDLWVQCVKLGQHLKGQEQAFHELSAQNRELAARLEALEHRLDETKPLMVQPRFT